MPVPPDQQQPGFLNSVGSSLQSGLQSIGSGIQSRNIVPALLLGGILGALPPLLYGKRDRRGAGRFWGNIGTQLAFNELERPDRERREKRDVMGRLVSSGMASTTGAPGAQPLGDYGGISVFKTPTIGEMFAESIPTPPTGGLTETDLGDGKSPMALPPAPRPMNPAMNIVKQLPATKENIAVLARISQGEHEFDLKRQQAEYERQQSKETRDFISGLGQQGDYDVSYGMGSKGGLTVRANPKSQPKPDKIEKRIAMVEQTLGRPLSPEEKLNVAREMDGSSLGKTLADQADRQFVNLESSRMNREMGKAQEMVNAFKLSIPRQYHKYAKSLAQWQMLKNDPKAMAAITEKRHGEIELALENYENSVRERDEFHRSMGAGQSQNVTMPYEQKGVKPASLRSGSMPDPQKRSVIQSDLREWGLK